MRRFILIVMLLAAIAGAIACWPANAGVDEHPGPGKSRAGSPSAPAPDSPLRSRGVRDAPNPEVDRHTTHFDLGEQDSRQHYSIEDSPRHSDVILHALDQGDEKTRLAAISVLARRGPAARSLIPVLEELLDDPSQAIRERAEQALAKIRRR